MQMNTSGAAHADSPAERTRGGLIEPTESVVQPIAQARARKTGKLYELLKTKDASFLDRTFSAEAAFDVAGLLPSRTAILFATEGGLIKTTECKRLALMMVFWRPGMMWMGRAVTEPRNGGKVIYISGDESEDLAIDGFLGLDGAKMRDAWVEANPGKDWVDRLKLVSSDEIDVIFRAEGQTVKRTRDGDDLYAFCEEFGPDLVVADTAAALTDIEIDGNTKHAQAIMRGAMAFTKLGPTWIWAHHFSKEEETRNIRAARKQTKGSAGLVDGGRAVINAWLAYPPVEQLVRDNEMGGARDGTKVICFGVSKGNVKGIEEGLTRVFVRNPSADRVTPPPVEITDELLKHPLGRVALYGIHTTANFEKIYTKYKSDTAKGIPNDGTAPVAKRGSGHPPKAKAAAKTPTPPPIEAETDRDCPF